MKVVAIPAVAALTCLEMIGLENRITLHNLLFVFGYWRFLPMDLSDPVCYSVNFITVVL